MKDIIKVIRKNLIHIWLFLAIAASAVLISYGAYTGLKAVKRVVTTKPSASVLFSSNCMMTTTNNKKINTAQFTVTVCNYDQNDPDSINPSAITYDLIAQIRVLYGERYVTMSELATALGAESDEYQSYVTRLNNRTYMIQKTGDDANGATGASFQFNSTNGYTTTFSSEVLRAGVKSWDSFQVTFDSIELSKTPPEFYIYVRAVPSGGGGNLNDIDCLLYAVPGVVDVASWTGALLETDTNRYDYDFYNYIINGSGSGTMTIMWDPDWFEVNPYFVLINNGAVGTISGGSHDGWKKIDIRVDSTQKNRYELQLYKVISDTPYTGTNAALNYVSYSFVAE